MNTPPPVGTRSDAVAMTRMYSAENGEFAPFVTWTTAVTSDQVEDRLEI